MAKDSAFESRLSTFLLLSPPRPSESRSVCGEDGCSGCLAGAPLGPCSPVSFTHAPVLRPSPLWSGGRRWSCSRGRLPTRLGSEESSAHRDAYCLPLPGAGKCQLVINEEHQQCPLSVNRLTRRQRHRQGPLRNALSCASGPPGLSGTTTARRRPSWETRASQSRVKD